METFLKNLESEVEISVFGFQFEINSVDFHIGLYFDGKKHLIVKKKM